MQNPSCLLYGPGIARFEDRPIPSIEDPHDVIIRIAYVGVCGSDVRSLIIYTLPFQYSNNINLTNTPAGPLLDTRRRQEVRLPR